MQYLCHGTYGASIVTDLRAGDLAQGFYHCDTVATLKHVDWHALKAADAIGERVGQTTQGDVIFACNLSAEDLMALDADAANAQARRRAAQDADEAWLEAQWRGLKGWEDR